MRFTILVAALAMVPTIPVVIFGARLAAALAGVPTA